MEVRNFCRNVLGEAYEVKEDIKENHYLELCNLIQKIYNHSEYEYNHKLRVCYSSIIFVASEWWLDNYGNIPYEKDMDDGIPEEIEVNTYYTLELNLKEQFNIVNDLEIENIYKIHNKICSISSKKDREEIWSNKNNTTKHINKIKEITSTIGIHEVNNIDIIIRSCKYS